MSLKIQWKTVFQFLASYLFVWLAALLVIAVVVYVATNASWLSTTFTFPPIDIMGAILTFFYTNMTPLIVGFTFAAIVAMDLTYVHFNRDDTPKLSLLEDAALVQSELEIMEGVRNGTEWRCVYCDSVNPIEERKCDECGAKRKVMMNTYALWKGNGSYIVS